MNGNRTGYFPTSLLNPLNARLYPLSPRMDMVKDIMEEVMHIHSERFIHKYLNLNVIYPIEQHRTTIHQILGWLNSCGS